jgi:hypothetical protein
MHSLVPGGIISCREIGFSSETFLGGKMDRKMYQGISRLLVSHNHCLLVSGKVFSQQKEAGMWMHEMRLLIGGFAREAEKVTRKTLRFQEQTLIKILQSLALQHLLKRGVIGKKSLTDFSVAKTDLAVIVANRCFLFSKREICAC